MTDMLPDRISHLTKILILFSNALGEVTKCRIYRYNPKAASPRLVHQKDREGLRLIESNREMAAPNARYAHQSIH